MPITVNHALSATTPDNTSYEIRPSHWNSSHVASLQVAGTEVIGAFSNANSVSFGTTPDGHITVSVASNQSNQTIGVTALGNTTINSASTFDARSMGLSGAGNISVGIVGSNLVLSATGGGNVLIVAAGTNVVTSGTAAFVNSNNVTFGMDTAGNVTANASYQTGVVFSASNAAANLSSIVLSNSNGLAFGLSGSTLTGSYTVPSTTGLISGVAFSAGTNVTTLTELAFQNANGVSFGILGTTLTASVLQSNQTEGFYALGNTTQGSSGTFDARSMSVQGLGNVSVGFSNGTLVISAVGTAPAGGVAISAGTQSTNTGVVIFSNSNGVTFGLSNGTLTATVNPGPAAGIAAIIAGTQTQTIGTISLINSNGISFGMSNTSQITAFYTVPSTAGLISDINVSAGTTSGNLSALTFSNSNGLIFGLNAGTITCSYTVPSTTGLISAMGVSAGTQASNLSAVTFNNANNVSFGLSAGTITGSAIVNISAGTQAAGYSAITLSNSNNVSFGLNAGVLTATATFVAQSNQTFAAYARGNTIGTSSSTYDARSMSFSGAGNIIVGNSAGAIVISASVGNTFSAYAASNTTQASSGTIAGSALSFAGAGAVSVGVSNGSVVISAAGGAQSVQTVGVYGISNTTGTTSSTYDARSMSFAGAGVISVGNSNGSIIISAPNTTGVTLLSAGMSTGGNTTGTTGLASNQLILAGGSNITLSGSTNAGSMTISIIGGAGGTGGASTLGAYAVSNTTQGSSGSVTASILSFLGAGVVSVGISNGSVIISGPASTGISQSLYATSNTTQSTSGTQPIGSLLFAGAGNVSVGVSNGSVVVSGAAGVNFGVSTGGNTAGATGTVSIGNVVLVGSGPISLSQATGAAGSAATITIYAPATSSISGTGLVSISTNGSTISVGAAIPQLSFFQPLGAQVSTTVTQNGIGSVQVYPAIAAFPFTATRVDMMASVSAAVLAASTEAQTLSMYVGLYSLNGSTLSLASSGSQSYAWTNSSGNSNASISGLRRFSAPINVNYTGGFDLFVGVMSNTTFANTNGISLSNVVVPLGPTAQLQGLIGQVPANSMQFVPGQGIFSATSVAMPSSMALSAISGAGSNGVAVDNYAPVQFVNMTA